MKHAYPIRMLIRFAGVIKNTLPVLFFLYGTIASAQPFTDSNLPIVVINTNSQQIMDSPKIPASFAIYYHPNGSRNYLTDAPYYTGTIGIEVRGASSSNMQKKSYGFETWDNTGNEMDTSLMGMPRESDWILYASHNDKTFIRNTLECNLYRGMGRYASRTQHCEMVLNGQYNGIYVLMEKIKRDSNRVDIAKLKATDTAGVEVTGGYIFKIDNNMGNNGMEMFSSSAPFYNTFYFDYPAAPHPKQKTYITKFVDSTEAAIAAMNFADTLTGYRHYLDYWSLIDYFLIFEMGKNPDAYGRSVYFVKQKQTDGGKLEMGPPWDFDLAWKNTPWCTGDNPTGFIYQNTGTNRLGWWAYLMQDQNFRNDMRCRWTYLRQFEFSNSYVTNYIDSMAIYLNESQQRNFATWPVLGQNVFINVIPYLQTYQAEIDSMKSFALQRLAWLDANLGGTCTSIGMPEQPQPAALGVYPVPFTNEINLDFIATADEPVRITIMDMAGRELDVQEQVRVHAGPNVIRVIPQGELASGVYLITVKGAASFRSARIIKR